MYKVGDKVLIKGEVVEVAKDVTYPIGVRLRCATVPMLFTEEELELSMKTYEMGLNDAWELVDKVYEMRNQQRYDVFGTESLAKVMDLSPQEAIAKIESYEQTKVIKVGDVVSFEDKTKALVVDESLENAVFVFTENGCVEKWDRTLLEKTGKHIDIESLLKQIGE